MRKHAILLGLAAICSSYLMAREYTVSSSKELAALQLIGGDKVVLKHGDWKDQRIIFKGNGTERKPITLTAERPGKTMLSGNSSLLIDGSWLVVDGLYFTDGYSINKDVIQFSNQSENCRLTNSAVVDFNNTDKAVDYKWVSVYGHNNRVDHCWFEGKTHQGTTVVVWLDDKPNYNRIDHNYFGPRPELGVNGGETIRIGTSRWSMQDSYTLVENNIFDRCDGEIEAISNKSGKNTLRNNLFYECKATLTLRHGNGSVVSGNVFLGNHKPGTGGVRIIGEDHKVHNNYFQDLAGTGLSAAISVMAGVPNAALNGHWQVKNACITNNVILNCKESLAIGAGKNAERHLPAINTFFACNMISTTHLAVQKIDENVVIHFKGNLLEKSTDAIHLREGFVVGNFKVRKRSNGLYAVNGNSVDPFRAGGKVGPKWLNLPDRFKNILVY